MTAVIVLAVVYSKQTARTRNGADRRTSPLISADVGISIHHGRSNVLPLRSLG